MNEAVYRVQPGAMTIAEESTAWAQVSRPTYLGGLGFGFKWNMGWMHDLLDYMTKEPVHLVEIAESEKKNGIFVFFLDA